MGTIYNNLETVTHTLDEFTERLNSSFVNHDFDAFIKTGLTGEYLDEDGAKKQVFIDPLLNHVQEDHQITITRDYDSAIGISEDILVTTSINVYAVPHPTFALTSSIHLKYPIERDGSTKLVEYHRIPNFELGTFGVRHHIHIFFPGLWSQDRSKSHAAYRLTEHERAFWYDKAFRPAIRSLLGPAVASEWPASYRTEEIRARKHRGGHAWGSKIIPERAVGGLMDRVRLLLGQDVSLNPEDVAWTQNFFVMHTIRGVKHSNPHNPAFFEAQLHLDTFFLDAKLSPSAHSDGKWWVDVGIEISNNENHCLQWVTGEHWRVVKHALGISDHDAQRITRINSSKYSRDLASHLTEISGFRITPGVRAQGVYEAAYIQAYTTDKAVVYNPEGFHHAKFIAAKEVLGPKQPSVTIDGIHTIYELARDKNGSNARLEVRVPYESAADVFVDIDEALLRDCLCSFSRDTWWNFRIIRLMAASRTFTLQEDGPSGIRFMPETLLLTAACLWLVNGIHARPEDGPASRDLMRAILPVTEESDAILDVLAYNTRIRPPWQHEDEESDPEEPVRGVPYNPYGCVFFRPIMLEEDKVDVPRFRCGGPGISPPSFSFFFDGMTRAEAQAKFQRSGILDKSAVRDIRFTTNKTSGAIYVNTTGAPQQNLFNLGAQGHVLAPPARDNGSDLEDESSPPPDDRPQDIDTQLSALWRQFVMDLTSKSPNQRGLTSPSYTRLDNDQRRSADEAPYMHLRLPEVFNAVWYKSAPSKRWEKSFNWLFPPVGHQTTKAAQNYHTCTYYRTWMGILEANKRNTNLIELIRRKFFERIRQWRWMPNAQCDRMWPTSAKKPSSEGFTRWPPAEGRPPGAHILLHSNDVPILELQENDGADEVDGDI